MLLNASNAGEERFDYGELGRLIRVVDEQNRVTEYVYDPAGNLLRVITGGTLTPLTITSVSPDTLRRGEFKEITATGNGLTGVRISTVEPGLQIGNMIVSGTQVRFTLAAADTAPLGPHPIVFANATGSTSAGVTVTTETKIFSTPNPLAIPPDGVQRQFSVHLTLPDVASRSFSLSVTDPSIAVVSPSTITFAPGETQALVDVRGLKAGQAVIRVASPSLINPLEVPVYVTTDFANINFTYAARLGVVRGDATAYPATLPGSPIVSRVLGIVKGDVTSPFAVTPGSPIASPPVGISKGDPTSPFVATPGSPITSQYFGISKGDPTSPLVSSPGSPTVSPVIGLVKGDVTSPIVPTSAGPVVSPIVGVDK